MTAAWQEFVCGGITFWYCTDCASLLPARSAAWGDHILWHERHDNTCDICGATTRRGSIAESIHENYHVAKRDEFRRMVALEKMMKTVRRAFTMILLNRGCWTWTRSVR